MRQVGVADVRTYTRGTARLTGHQLNVTLLSEDPPADWSFIFRLPTTEVSKGYVIGTCCSITVQGDPCACACILSTEELDPSEVLKALKPFSNVLVDRKHDHVINYVS